MSARDTLTALRQLGVDTSSVTIADLTAPPMPRRQCAACPRKVDVLVSTTGRRWVCLACAHNITRAAEQRAVLEEAS